MSDWSSDVCSADRFWTDLLLYQGGSDAFLGPRTPIRLADEAWGIDFEAEVAVIVDDVPMGASREQAAAAIRLVMLVNDVSLRNLVPGELAKGFGFFQSKPSRSEEHTSELQSLMRISYAVFCLKKK